MQIARTPAQIGAALRRQRRRLKLSQVDLADKAGLRQATISAAETGNTQLTTLCDILAALGLELVVQPRSTATIALEDIF